VRKVCSVSGFFRANGIITPFDLPVGPVS
jgi:hypothetical protein